MKMTYSTFVLPVMIAMFLASFAFAQNEDTAKQAELSPQISEFLKSDAIAKKYRATYTGRQISFPDNMKEMFLQLYLHKFTIVGMRINRDISSVYRELLVVTNAETGAVESYFWQQGWDEMNEAFSKILTAYPKERWGISHTWPEVGAMMRLNAMAKVMLYLQRDEKTLNHPGIGPRVGSIFYTTAADGKDRVFSVEIIPEFWARYKLTLEMKFLRQYEESPFFYRDYSYGQLKVVPLN